MSEFFHSLRFSPVRRTKIHLGCLMISVACSIPVARPADTSARFTWLKPGSYSCTSEHLMGFPKDARGNVSELHFEPEPRSFAITVGHQPGEETYTIETRFAMTTNAYGRSEADDPTIVTFKALAGEGWLSLRDTPPGEGGPEFVVFYLEAGEKRFLSGHCSAKD